MVILLAVIFALASNTLRGPGQIIVTAETSARYSPSRELRVGVTVGGTLGTTPLNLSLQQGTYTVDFLNVPWYVTPAPRVVTVLPGVAVYAIGKYVPIIKPIGVTQSSFNVTSTTALIAVTPVVWVNASNSYVVLNISSVGKVVINSGQNFTHIFSQAGTYDFGFFFGGAGGSVTVS